MTGRLGTTMTHQILKSGAVILVYGLITIIHNIKMNLFIFINVYISSRSFNNYQDVIDLKPKTNVSDLQDDRIIVQKLN